MASLSLILDYVTHFTSQNMTINYNSYIKLVTLGIPLWNTADCPKEILLECF